MNRLSTAEVLNKAYRLAYFLHQDKGVAMRIVAAATLKLNVAMAVQSKRLYYIPVGRFSRGDSRRTDGIRNKALFSDLHLLQRLVYGESEPYERQKERAALAGASAGGANGDQASEEDLLVYFIKHLVRITTKRNAFYVTLGVSRLLHNYSTLETMEIYNAVIGEPERVKDDYYYRSRKAVLMHEMYQRFGQLIRACRQRRGEERFETQPGSNELRSLVRECLRLFTPWDTQCPVPPDFDPFKSVIASLISKSNADENKVEVNRIHAILHPDCFARLIAAFGYSPPPERMELPRFFLHETSDQIPPRPRSTPVELNAEELAEINHTLAEQSRRRRRSSPTAAIRIIVDGVERGRLNPAAESNISFSAEADAEIIEVRTTDADGDLLLATHVLTSFGKAPDEAIVASIRLEGGQDLSLSITRKTIDANGEAELLVKFGYQETDPRRAVRLWWQRRNLRRHSEQGARGLWDATISARHILVFVSLFLICAVGYLGYRKINTRLTTEAPIPTPTTEQPDQAAAKATGPQLAQNRSQPPQRPKTDRTATSKKPASPVASAPARNTDEDVDAVRSGAVVPNLKLSEVKKVYVEIRGGPARDELRSSLIENLSSSGVIAATNADEADAALKIVVSQNSVSVMLVNARGTVLWPKAGGARRYSGEISKVSAEIMKDLLSEIRLAK